MKYNQVDEKFLGFDLEGGTCDVAIAEYKLLQSRSTYLSEQAKIEGETNVEDLNGEEIYLDVEVSRDDYDVDISELLMKAIETARSTIEKSGLTAEDIDKIIFIGAPNNYKPIRDRVVNEPLRAVWNSIR